MLRELQGLLDRLLSRRPRRKRSMIITGRRDTTLSENVSAHCTIAKLQECGTRNSMTAFTFPSPAYLEAESQELYLACRVHLMPGLKTGVLSPSQLKRNCIGSILQGLIQERSSSLKGRLTSWPRAYLVKQSLSAELLSMRMGKPGYYSTDGPFPVFGSGSTTIQRDEWLRLKLLNALGGW